MDLSYKILYSVGFWPLEKNSKRTPSYIFRYLFPIIMVVRCMYTPIFHLMSLRASWTNTAIKIEETMSFVGLFILASKLLTMYVYRRRVAAVFQKFSELNQPRQEDLKECEIIQDRTDRLCRKLTKVLLSTFLCVVIVMIVAVFAEALHTRSIPTRRWLPFDYSQSPLLEVTAIVCLVLEGMDVLIVGLADSLFLVIMLQAVAQFKILRHRLSNVATIVQNRVCNTVRDRKLFFTLKHNTVQQPVPPELLARAADVDLPNAAILVSVVALHEVRLRRKTDDAADNYLRRCVEDHVELIQLTQEIQAIFGKMLTSQLLFNAFLASFALYVAMVPQVDMLLVMAVVGSCGGMTQLLAYCMCAHALTDESEGVRAAAYDCDWPDAGESFKRALRLVMCRADRPLQLRAAGLPLNRNTFRMVLRITWYLFRVVLKIANGEKIKKRPA